MENCSVEWVLRSLNLYPYTHIVIKKRSADGIVCLGGSDRVFDIIHRFGGMIVEHAYITSDGIFIIFVYECNNLN